MAWLPEGLVFSPTQKIRATVAPLTFTPLIAAISAMNVPGKKVAGAVIFASMVVEVPFICGLAKLSWYWIAFSISMVRMVAGGACPHALDPSPAAKARPVRITRRRIILFPFLLNALWMSIKARNWPSFAEVMSVVSFLRALKSSGGRVIDLRAG